MDLEVSVPKVEGQYRASKWLSFQMLLTAEELKGLLLEIEAETFLCISDIGKLEELKYTKEQYIGLYSSYLEAMSQSDETKLKDLSKRLCVAIAYEGKSFYKIQLEDGRVLLKIKKPAIQIKPFSFVYNKQLEKFLFDVKSPYAIYFGLEFSFPQIFQDPKSFEIQSVFKDQKIASAVNFKKIRAFVREKTKPVKFQIEDKVKITTFRIGKKCLNFAKSYKFLQKERLFFIGE